MKTTNYICDMKECNKSVGEKDLNKFTIEFRSEGYKIKGLNDDRYTRQTYTMEICDDCMNKKGFTIIPKEKVEKETAEQIKVDNAAVLKEKIFDLLKEVGVVFESDLEEALEDLD